MEADSSWQDVSFADAVIYVRRTWTCGAVGLPKSEASKAPAPMHPLLAEFMTSGNGGRLFRTEGLGLRFLKLKGRQPWVANMLVKTHLRQAASKAGHSLIALERKG